MCEAFLTLVAELTSRPESYAVLERVVNNVDYVPLCFELMNASDAPQNMKFVASIVAGRIATKLVKNQERLVQVFGPFRESMLSLIASQSFDVASVVGCYLKLLRRAPGDDFLALEARAMELLEMADVANWVLGFQLLEYVLDAYIVSPVHSANEFYSKFANAAARFIRFETLMNPEFSQLEQLIFRTYRKLVPHAVENFDQDPIVAQVIQILEHLSELTAPVESEAITQTAGIVCDVLSKIMCDVANDTGSGRIPVILRAAQVSTGLFPDDTYSVILTSLLEILVTFKVTFTADDLSTVGTLALAAVQLSDEEIARDCVNPEILYEELFECKSFSSRRALGLALIRHLCSINLALVIPFIKSKEQELSLESRFRIWSQVSEFIMGNLELVSRDFVVSYGSIITPLYSIPTSNEIIALSKVAFAANTSFLCSADQQRELEATAIQLLSNQGPIAYVYCMVGYTILERLTRLQYRLSQESLVRVFVSNQSIRIGFDQLSILNRIASSAKEELQSISRHIQSFLIDRLSTYMSDTLEYIYEIPNAFRCLANLVASPYSEIDMESLGGFVIGYLNSDELEEVGMCCQILACAVERGLPGCPQILSMVLDSTAFKDLEHFSEMPSVELLYGTFMAHEPAAFAAWPGRPKLLEFLLGLYQIPQEVETDTYYITVLLCQLVFLKAIDERNLQSLFEHAVQTLLTPQTERSPIQDLAFLDIVVSIALTLVREIPQPILEHWRHVVQTGMVLDQRDHQFHLMALSRYCQARGVATLEPGSLEKHYLEDEWPILITRKPHPFLYGTV